MSEKIGRTTFIRSNIVEQVLEQGQRLRNAMVKSILDNDPFYVDVVDRNTLNNSHIQKGKSTKIISNQEKIVDENLTSSHKQRSTAFLKHHWDDSSPVATPPTMSTEFFDFYCSCETCNMYRNQNLWARKHLSADTRHVIGTEKLRTFSGPTLSSYDSEDSTNLKGSADNNTRINFARRDLPELNLKKDDRQEVSTSTLSYGQQDQTKTVTSEVQSQPDSLSDDITKSIQDNYRARAMEYFKYVNSLKITIHSLTLNQAGNRKVSISSVDSKYKLPTSFSHSYFIEYSVPDCLINTQVKTKKSKVDSGLSANLFRICSKKLQNEEIFFKHSSIHDIVSLLQLNLQDIEIKFQVSSRTMKQKLSNVLGYSTFNMSSFEVTKHLCYTQSFPVVHEDFTLGTLKMTLQLGCGRMYFGKEFVEFVINNTKSLLPPPLTEIIDNTDQNSPSSQQASSVIYVEKPSTDYSNKVERISSNISSAKPYSKSLVNLSTEKPSPSITTYQQQISRPESMKSSLKHVSLEDKHGIESSIDTNRSEFQSSIVKENTNFPKRYQNSITTSEMDNKSLLYGLVYISEAQYFESPINSYLSCQVFCQGDTLCSRVVYNSKDPVFNFYQKVPFLFDDSFLLCMRDNSITVDFWERYDDDDIAIGTSQLSLHQFFVAYRNKIIADTLLQNRLPVTISDWWEPICSPVNGKIYGQMKVLVAVGTATQIHNLEVERGLKDNSLTVTYIPIVPEARSVKKRQIDLNSTNTDRSTHSFKRPDYLNKNLKGTKRNITVPTVEKGKRIKDTQLINNDSKKVEVTEVKKIDIGVQSDARMESHNKSEPPAAQTSSKTENMLEAFLTQLIEQKAKNIYVENATNTENVDIHNNLTKNLNNEKLGTSVTQSLNKLSQCKNATNMQLRKTSDLIDYLNEALTVDGKPLPSQLSHSTPSLDDDNNFKAHVIVEGALHLPCKRKCKPRKTRKKNISYEEVLPSTYVTFETIQGADLKISPVVQRSANPEWDFRCDVLLPGEILINSQKRLIFKVWRKNNGNSLQPNLQTDVVLGFAALDLTVLLAGLPSVQGWFNIVDFSSKCNGQIKIHVTPLENISRFNESNNVESHESVIASPAEKTFINKQLLRKTLEVKEEPTELLNRALKRKFTELEEITQRLRSRLADVTKDDSDTSNDGFIDEFERDINTLCVEEDYNLLDLGGAWTPQPFSSLENGANNYLLKEVTVNDDASSMDQFASNKPSIYSKGAFSNEPLLKYVASDSAYGSTRLSDKTENIPKSFVPYNFSSSSSNELSESGSQLLHMSSPSRVLTPADKQLIAGKQRIDTLLEKLTLLSGTDTENVFPSRYVSGCSVNQDVPACSDNRTSKETEIKSGSNFNIDAILNPALFNQLCSFDMNSLGSLTEPSEGLEDSSSNAQIDNGSSSNSLLTQFSTYRQAPDGAGNSVEGGLSRNKPNV